MKFNPFVDFTNQDGKQYYSLCRRDYLSGLFPLASGVTEGLDSSNYYPFGT